MESNWARYLEFQRQQGLIFKWEYEPLTLWFDQPRGTGQGIRRGVVSYKPDFRLTQNDGSILYQEVKGYMTSENRTALKRLKIYYPEITIEVIDTKRYNRVARQVGAIIKNWE
jgi:hypothetical protein